MKKRKIIKIDEDKCNGCGLCVPSCHEGAIKIIDGKAKVIEDVCDGLGACLGNCPQGAISIEERNVADHHPSCACPGSVVKDLRKQEEEKVSCLSNWPVQIKLVPVGAQYFDGADLVIAADCTAFSYTNFHEDFLKGKLLLIGCPKLDDADFYQEKFTEIFKTHHINSLTCLHMEVPCCFGLVKLVEEAITASGKNIKFEDVTISIKGKRL